MNLFRKTAAMAVTMLLCASSGLPAAMPQPEGCVTPAELEDLFVVIAPDLLNGITRTCSASLPATATLRQGPSGFVARYKAASDAAWPSAAPMILRTFPKTDQGKSTAGMSHAAFSAAITPGLVAMIQPKDCALVDRLAMLLAPLPPRNTAGLLVTMMPLVAEDEEDEPPLLKICPPAG